MTERLRQRIVNHLLSERAILHQNIEELFDDRNLADSELRQAGECEQLLIDIAKEQNEDQEPQRMQPAVTGQTGETTQ
jgi:hypothetical protein